MHIICIHPLSIQFCIIQHTKMMKIKNRIKLKEKKVKKKRRAKKQGNAEQIEKVFFFTYFFLFFKSVTSFPILLFYFSHFFRTLSGNISGNKVLLMILFIISFQLNRKRCTRINGRRVRYRRMKRKIYIFSCS